MSDPDDVLFWIAARNWAASEALQNINNQHYVVSMSELEKAFVVTINGPPSQTPGCLLSLGRDGDIELSGSLISSIQCQILLNPSTKEILLRDRSFYNSTKVELRSSTDSLYFGMQGPRQVVLRHGDSIHIGMGGDNSCLFHFEIMWPPPNLVMSERLEKLKANFVQQPRKSRLAVTLEETSTPGSRYESRIQTPGSGEIWLHRRLKILGSGAFGEVHKTVNMHTGDYYAVKVLRHTGKIANDVAWRKDVLREVTTLQKLYHPHIAEYCHSQGFQTGAHPVEIFMFLYAGSVEDYLTIQPNRRRDSAFLERVFNHILKGLMFIAHLGIIHRDVKPANILYQDADDGELRFVLADFGLSKEQVLARTLDCGTPIYMAPEVSIRGMQQTHKVDVYSLGVTMLAVGAAGGFDEASIGTREDISTAIMAGLRDDPFAFLGQLLHKDPAPRPSAQEIFLKHWPHDQEAINLRPKAGEQPPVTANDSNPKRRKGVLQIGNPGDPAGTIKTKHTPTGVAKRAQNVRGERQKSTTMTTRTADLFSQIPTEPSRRRFT